jgi:hypothetical protein
MDSWGERTVIILSSVEAGWPKLRPVPVLYLGGRHITRAIKRFWMYTEDVVIHSIVNMGRASWI